MKILLIGERLAQRSFNGANKALPVLASCLANAGFDQVDQYDLERGDICFDDVLHAAGNADLIAFAGCMSPQWPELDGHGRRLERHLHKTGKSATPVLVGGYATKGVHDIAAETSWADGYFNGEGDQAMVAIAQSVARGTFRESRSDIDGLCYHDGDRFHFSVSTRLQAIDQLDQGLGFVHVPAIHDMDIFQDASGRQLKTAQIFTQRGCPWQCTYCNKSTETNAVVRLSEESFRTQLRRLRREGFEAVYLDVDTFTLNEARAKREADILAEEGFAWGSNTRIDRIDSQMLQYLYSRGCSYMFFGVEHVLPEVLLAIGKFNGPLSAQIERAGRYTRLVEKIFREMDQLGFPSSYFLILGLPRARLDEDRTRVLGYECTTFEDDMQAVRFGLEVCNPDFLNFNLLRFMPGSTAADAPGHAAYSCVRPSGGDPITAGYFLPRVAAARGYAVPENHGIMRLCESVGLNQPATIAVDAQRIHDTFVATIELLNRRIDAGGKPTRLFLDREIIAQGLVTRDDRGRYSMAPLREFEGL